MHLSSKYSFPALVPMYDGKGKLLRTMNRSLNKQMVSGGDDISSFTLRNRADELSAVCSGIFSSTLSVHYAEIPNCIYTCYLAVNVSLVSHSLSLSLSLSLSPSLSLSLSLSLSHGMTPTSRQLYKRNSTQYHVAYSLRKQC